MSSVSFHWISSYEVNKKIESILWRIEKMFVVMAVLLNFWFLSAIRDQLSYFNFVSGLTSEFTMVIIPFVCCHDVESFLSLQATGFGFSCNILVRIDLFSFMWNAILSPLTVISEECLLGQKTCAFSKRLIDQNHIDM